MENNAKLSVVIVMAVVFIAGAIIVPAVFKPPPLPVAISMNGEKTPLKYSRDNVYIIHTNDTLGFAMHDDVSVIGFDYIAGIKSAYGQNALLVDAGDFSSGTPFASFTKGEAVQDVMRAAGYNCAVVGDREFDYAGNIEAMSDRLSFALISANITKNGEALLPPAFIRTLPNKTKIGFIGITTPNTALTSGFAEGYDFGTPDEIIEITKKQAVSLREQGCSIVIVLSHLGTNADDALSSIRLADSAGTLIDAIIDGHSGSAPLKNRRQNGVWIVSAGSGADSYAGLLLLKKSKGKYIAEPYYIDYETAVSNYEPDADVSDRIKRYNAEIPLS